MPTPTSRDTERPAIYRTPQEKRESGLQRELTPWLQFSGLIEGEVLTHRAQTDSSNATATLREKSATLQLGFIALLNERTEAEVILQYDSDPDRIEAEEAFISFDFEPFELSLGKQFTPFGLYYSNFITGPMLEFGETRAPHMAQLSFAYADQLELNIAAYDGWAQPQGQGDRLDWAIGFEHLPLHGFSWGLSYQTDLADADEHLIEDNRYAQRVSALSGFVSGYTEYFGCSFEILSAMGEFQEQDAKYNRPQAWNLEFSYFPPAMDFDVALRLEMSRELEDQPEVQYGVATTWYLNRQIIVMLEYLHGRFRTETDVTEREESFSEIQRVNSLNAKLSIEF